MFTSLAKLAKGRFTYLNALMHSMGKDSVDDTPLAVSTVLAHRNLNAALQALHTVTGYEADLRALAVFSAKQVLHLCPDTRSVQAFKVAERFAKGLATEAQLTVARSQARQAWLEAAPESAESEAANAVRYALFELPWYAADAASVAALQASRLAGAKNKVRDTIANYLRTSKVVLGTQLSMF